MRGPNKVEFEAKQKFRLSNRWISYSMIYHINKAGE